MDVEMDLEMATPVCLNDVWKERLQWTPEDKEEEGEVVYMLGKNCGDDEFCCVCAYNRGEEELKLCASKLYSNGQAFKTVEEATCAAIEAIDWRDEAAVHLLRLNGIEMPHNVEEALEYIRKTFE